LLVFQGAEGGERRFIYLFINVISFHLHYVIFNHIFSFRVGYQWITRLAALGIYAALLMPGFLQGVYFCCMSIS
jgi:hypothetical protein